MKWPKNVHNTIDRQCHFYQSWGTQDLDNCDGKHPRLIPGQLNKRIRNWNKKLAEIDSAARIPVSGTVGPDCTDASRLFGSGTSGRPKLFRNLNYKKIIYNNKWEKRKINDMCCVLPYIIHIGMFLPKRVGFLRRFGPERVLCPFSFQIGYGFEGSSREGLTKLFILVIPNG